jgi:hypothetical protein
VQNTAPGDIPLSFLKLAEKVACPLHNVRHCISSGVAASRKLLWRSLPKFSQKIVII